MNKLVWGIMVIVALIALSSSITALSSWGTPGRFNMHMLENQIGYPILGAVSIVVLMYAYKTM